MKKILFLLLIAALLFWRLGQQTHTVTLPEASSATPIAGNPPPGLNAGISSSTGHETLEIRIAGVDMDYYDVSGSSAVEIRHNLNRQHVHGGFDGYTGWNVHWNWPGFGSNTCDLDSASLQTDVRVRLPRWQPPRDADPALVLKWNNYLGSLAHHEQGHVQLARQGFAKMQQILQSSSCAEADAKLNAVLGEMRQADLRYDADTGHGSTQGAKFP